MSIQRSQSNRFISERRAFVSSSLKHNQGFTLLELIVVLVIMVLGFSAISMNLSSGNDSTELKTTARDMASALRGAKGLAQMSHKETTLTIDRVKHTYTVSRNNKVYDIPQNIVPTMSTTLQDLDKSGDRGSIRFFPDGSSTGGWIKLARGKSAWRININWLTGHIELKDVVQ